MYKLMIKTHCITGLKYLCYTQKDDHESYHWRRHLREHGKIITTQLIFETNDYQEFVQVARQKSIEFNVVENPQWANLKHEEGDGGDTVSSLRWITDGVNDKYHPADSVTLPEGWRWGRTKCKFTDSSFQREMSKRSHAAQTHEIRKQAAAKAAQTKKENGSFRDISGDKNPAKREDVKMKIKQSALARPMIKCPHCNKVGQSSPGMYRFHFDNCKHGHN
jgi:hypothetical protein